MPPHTASPPHSSVLLLSQENHIGFCSKSFISPKIKGEVLKVIRTKPLCLFPCSPISLISYHSPECSHRAHHQRGFVFTPFCMECSFNNYLQSSLHQLVIDKVFPNDLILKPKFQSLTSSFPQITNLPSLLHFCPCIIWLNSHFAYLNYLSKNKKNTALWIVEM